MAGNFLGNLIGTFEGKTSKQIIAEARNGLAVASELISKINKKMDIHQHPYLGEKATAVDSQKLEGQNRASIISDARNNLATLDNLSNGLNTKLDKNGQAENSLKVGGYGVAQIITEAKSGTSRNATKVKETDLPVEVLKDIEATDLKKLKYKGKILDYFGRYAHPENIQLPRMISFDEDYELTRFKKIGDKYVLGYAKGNEIVFYYTENFGENWKRIINNNSSIISIDEAYDFGLGESGEFCLVYVDGETKYVKYVGIDIPNNTFKSPKILSDDCSETNKYTKVFISEQNSDKSFCMFYHGKNESYSNNIGLYYQFYNGASVNESDKIGNVEVVSYDFAEGGNQVSVYAPPISDGEGFIMGYTVENGTSTLARVTGLDSYSTEAINTNEDKILYYKHIDGKIWFITDAGKNNEAVGYLLKSTFSDIQFQPITKSLLFTAGCHYISDDGLNIFSKDIVSINKGEKLLKGLEFSNFDLGIFSSQGHDLAYLKPMNQTSAQIVSFKEIEKHYDESEY